MSLLDTLSGERKFFMSLLVLHSGERRRLSYKGRNDGACHCTNKTQVLRA